MPYTMVGKEWIQLSSARNGKRPACGRQRLRCSSLSVNSMKVILCVESTSPASLPDDRPHPHHRALLATIPDQVSSPRTYCTAVADLGGRRSRMRTRRPCARRVATRCCPIKPLPPVTSACRIGVFPSCSNQARSDGNYTDDFCKSAARSRRNPSATKSFANRYIGLISM